MADQNGFLDVNEARIYYTIQGEGEALVMAHAGVADSRMWEAQVAFFSSQYCVVTFDWRGFGQSNKPDASFSYRNDLKGVMDALEIEKAHLLACSMGGSGALNFTVENPERVDKLILVASGLNGFTFAEETEALWAALEAPWDAGDFDRVAELETQMWIDGPKRTPDQVDPKIRAYAKETTLRSYPYEEIGTAEKMEPPTITRLGEVQAPTLVIVGDHDVQDMQRISDTLAEQITGAKKVVMNGVAHLPNMEKPDEFNQIVQEFLNL